MTRTIAITRGVSPAIERCELTHLTREPVDFERAVRQHRAYEETLSGLGCELIRLAPAGNLPDSVFVEDTALVLDELAVLTRPGAESRRTETTAVASVLGELRPLVSIGAPATLDGGDCLVLGRTIYVGRSRRSDERGIEALFELVAPFGYRVQAVPIRHCLHLKSAVTHLGEDTLLVQPDWVDPQTFGRDWVAVDPAEVFAANALRVRGRVLLSTAFPRTAEKLAGKGYDVVTVEADELAKAEGGVTCCSLLVHRGS